MCGEKSHHALSITGKPLGSRRTFMNIQIRRWIALGVTAVWMLGCGTAPKIDIPAGPQGNSEYIIGPGDNLQIFVWRNPEVSITLPVRPDGKISTPLVEDLVVTGKTPHQVAREIEKRLSSYLKDPLVTVIVTSFLGPFNQQVRIVGAATKPQTLRYFSDMTLLDVMISVGGLTDLASGNRATIVRQVGKEQKQFPVRLNDLIRDGDITANVEMAPGDILIIPEAWF